ncbi:AAA family ATPase [Aliarcobacter butzleri]|uniref:AAA family ATPase n=1 Tax=Aliarcobacter butzleri TaxID=28197 RepID=UPI00317EAAF9
MELVYLWVEEYKNIRNQGFNFSPRFKCEYNQDTKELTINENENYVSIFPNNINITAIVGENGSGKSSVFEALYLMTEACKEKLFYVYTFDNKKFYYKTNSNFSVSSNNVSLEKKDINISYLGLSFIPNLQRKILNAKKKEKRISYTENYKMEFIYKFIDVFKKNNQILKRIDYKFIFDKLKIIIYRDTLISEEKLNIQNGLGNLSGKFSYKTYETFLKKTHSKIKKLIQDNIEILTTNPLSNRLLLSQMRNSSGDLIKDIKISFLINYMNNLISLFSNMDNINHNNFNSVNNIFNDLSFENLFVKIKEFEQKINTSNDLLKAVLKNIDFFEKWIKFCDKNKNLFIKENDNFYLILNLDDNLVKEALNFKDLFTISNEFNTFSLLEIELLSYDSQVDFFGLSSGEQKRLSLYIETIDSYFFSDSKILLLDEPDTFLHPQWSKIFISDLLKVLPKGKKNKHLIFTSHSPFILSDIPKENVIFLDKFDDKTEKKYPKLDIKGLKIGNCINVSKHIELKTFGANIHTLLSNGFFMSDGLMGEFAQNKINNVIKKLKDKNYNPSKNEKENILATIKVIGEDFLKTKLLDMYYKKFDDDFIKKQRKEELLEQQEKIKKELENL